MEKYKNSNLPVEERVNDLLRRMTSEEKARQINMYPWLYENWAGAASPLLSKDGEYSEEHLSDILGDCLPGMIRGLDKVKIQNAKVANRLQKYAAEKSRLGIPLLFICEGPHGYVGADGTIFPQNIAIASTFDRGLARKMGEITAREARSVGINVIKGPILDISQDPRWGRVEETFGEDPFLISELGLAVVKGMQGNLKSDECAVSMLKHFAAYGNSEGGRNTAPAHMGERELREIVLPPFDEAIADGGALAVMAAYNEIDGIPCSADRSLLEGKLRQEMGFKGFVQSDAGSIKMIYENHCADTDEEAIRQCLEAGIDIQNYDYPCQYFEAAVLKLLAEKKLAIETLDRAVVNILRVKFLLGLFENPYIDENKAEGALNCESHRQSALDAARASVCLLKNENCLLPLRKDLKKVAVIGPNADRKIYGSYIGHSDWDVDLPGTSVLDNIRKAVSPGTEILYAAGCELINSAEKGGKIISAHSFMRDYIKRNLYESLDSDTEIQKACDMAKIADAAVVVLGEAPWITSSEGMDRADVGLTGDQLRLVQSVYQTGKPTVVILFNGRPLVIPWIAGHIPAILEAWYPGQVGGKAVTDVLFGSYNPAGRLPVSFPRSSAQLPVYYNYKINARGKYLDMDLKPVYPFGHGLSYTRFAYYGLRIDVTGHGQSPKVYVRVDVANEGKYDGDEAVLLYLRDCAASVTVRNKALKGFEKVHFKAGERKTVCFELGFEHLSLIGRDMKRILEPGEFEVFIEGSTEKGLSGKFTIDSADVL